MVLGLAVNEAVGARAGAGGGGAEATFFLPQALTASTTASATIIRIHRLLVSFNSSSSTFQREHSHQFMAGPKCDPSAPISPASRRGSSSPFSARPERTRWLPGNYRRSGGCMSRRQLEMRPSVRLSRQDVSQRPFDAIHLLANHPDRLLMAGIRHGRNGFDRVTDLVVPVPDQVDSGRGLHSVLVDSLSHLRGHPSERQPKQHFDWKTVVCSIEIKDREPIDGFAKTKGSEYHSQPNQSKRQAVKGAKPQ